MKILITGGAGFIGSHTTRALREAGHEILVYDDLSNGHKSALLGAPLFDADIRDAEKMAECFANFKPDAVFHFAALIEAGRSVKEPALFYDVNVNGTYNLLSAIRKFEVKYLVFSSTAAVYGHPQKIPITEDCAPNPINPYGETKHVAETMLLDANRKWGLEFASLRYFNAAGSAPDAKIGENHHPETHLIPLVIDVALGRTGKLNIYGDDYDTPDGTCIRDYVHVYDLAEAHVKALAYIQTHDSPFICNLGTGRGYSVKQVIKTVEEITRLTVPYDIAPRRTGDPAILVCDPEKARKKLDWYPHYPDLESMIAHCYAYRKEM